MTSSYCTSRESNLILREEKSRQSGEKKSAGEKSRHPAAAGTRDISAFTRVCRRAMRGHDGAGGGARRSNTCLLQWSDALSTRHARACRGHPRLTSLTASYLRYYM